MDNNRSLSFLTSTLFTLVLAAAASNGSSTDLPFSIKVSSKKTTFSEGITVMIFADENSPDPPNKICIDVEVDSDNIVASSAKNLIDTTGLKDNMIKHNIPFTSRSAQIAKGPISVTLVTYLPNDDDSAECTSNGDVDTKRITVELTDNRVVIGWHETDGTCSPNRTCVLFVDINGGSQVPFTLTAAIKEGENYTVFMNDTSNPASFIFVPPQEGEYDVTLSVSNSITNLVYWSRRTMKLSVKIATEDRLEILEMQVGILQRQIRILQQTIRNLTTEIPCMQLHCGKYSTCDTEAGKCVCTYGDVYNGPQCTDFVGCDNFNACGDGGRGECVEPEHPEKIYACECKNRTHVTGKDCEECSKSICSSRESCVVDANGQPTCKCKENVTGPTCEECDDSYCHNRGNCTVDDTGNPTCQCAEFVDSPTCAACDGENACNGGKCVDGECDCAGTDQAGSQCEYPECTNKCDDSTKCYFKDSGTICYCDGVHKEAQCDEVSHTQTVHIEPPSPTPPSDPCDPSPCESDGACTANDEVDVGYTCNCLPGYTGNNCENKKEEPITSPATQGVILNQSDNNSQLLYGGLAVFIAILVLCVAAYLAYHNREKILELFGGKKESVVEMAMRSRTKNKGYKKLPTSIHDTLTHED